MEPQVATQQPARKAQKENRVKHYDASSNQAARHVLPIVCAAALAAVFAVLLPQPAYAARITSPPVPPDLQVPAGNKPFLVGHALGTQNYVCTPSASSPSGVAYVLVTPEATLFSNDGGEVITHFFSPNPNPLDPNTNPAVMADGAIRATWRHTRDTSTIWAKLNPKGSVVVKQDAIAWLLLKVVGAEDGPTGGDELTKTTFIQRLNTTGGLAPSTGCAFSTDVGNQAFVPYTADYFFYFNPNANQ